MMTPGNHDEDVDDVYDVANEMKMKTKKKKLSGEMHYH
jgi:hypothetical protein